MHFVHVTTKEEAYNVLIGPALLGRLSELYPKPPEAGSPVLVVADSNTDALFGDLVAEGLGSLGYRVERFVFPAGEGSKTASTLAEIHEAAFRAGLTRRDRMVALGGGVVGDLTGFAAATYMRGIEYIQIPTTLLAQVDSSVGGKTGIDTPYGKNLIGAFKQPRLVIADVSTLETLPFEQLACGMAEVIKYGLLEGERFFAEIESLPAAPPSAEIITACVRQKADTVARDEKEANIRAFLNLGHSFGHAIEKASNYTRYTHGAAVGLGLLAALRIGEQLGLTPAGLLPRLQVLLQSWNLPVTTDLSLAEVLPNLTADKKRSGSGIQFVVLEDYGKPLLHWISDELLAELAPCLSGFVLDVGGNLPDTLVLYPGQIKGEVYPPPSKSQAHRVIICTALAARDETADFTRSIRNFAEARSQDIDTTAENIRLLLEAARFGDSKPLQLDCGESGSTVRFLIPIAAALGVEACFTGRGRLPQRPLDAYREPLESNGVSLRFPKDPGFHLPLTVSGQLRPGTYRIAGDSSSQYITGMLMAMCLLDAPSTLQLTTNLESAPYVDMTLETLRQFGQSIEEGWQEGLLTYQVVPVGGLKRPAEPITIERDYSQAAFWYLAAYLGQPIEVNGLRPGSHQGDRAILTLLENLAKRRSGEDYGAVIEIDVAQFPDLFPALGVAAGAAGAGKRTRLVNAARLRIKESDRLAATADLLKRLGVPTQMGEDYLEIEGIPHFRGGELDSFGDHRLAMAAAVAALEADGPSRILKASAIAKSYPSFYRELCRLGARCERE